MMVDRVGFGVVRVPGWERFNWLAHGFSTRAGGVSSVYGGDDLNLGFTKDDSPAAVRENRRRVAEAICGSGDVPIIAVRQVHGTAVRLVAEGETGLADDEGRATEEADGLLTASSGVLLGVQAADCVPILVADTKQRVVAAFHAGWRGTAAAILQKGVAEMQSNFRSKPEDLVGAVGPAIGVCCYTVGTEVRERFGEAFPHAEEFFSRRTGGVHLDLAEANRRQLVSAGLPEDAIVIVGECTGCTRLADGSRSYFSHRAENGFTGRAMGLIGLVSERVPGRC